MNSATETWSRLGDRFSGEHAQFSWSDGVAFVGLIAILSGFFALLALLQHLRNEGWFARGQNGLFFELCRAHRLDRKSRSLLSAVAKSQQVETPAVLFLQPSRLVDVGNELSSEQQLRLEWLRERLFAGTDDFAAKGVEQKTDHAPNRAIPGFEPMALAAGDVSKIRS